MGLKIILVDDDAVGRDILREALLRLGHEVVGEVEDGMDAVAMNRFRQSRPDLVFVDVDVTFLEGLNALAVVRKVFVSTGIILMTATDTPVEETKSVGAFAAIRTPCHPETLKSTLDHFESVQRESRQHRYMVSDSPLRRPKE